MPYECREGCSMCGLCREANLANVCRIVLECSRFLLFVSRCVCGSSVTGLEDPRRWTRPVANVSAAEWFVHNSCGSLPTPHCPRSLLPGALHRHIWLSSCYGGTDDHLTAARFLIVIKILLSRASIECVFRP